jgi:hypothetical protein
MAKKIELSTVLATIREELIKANDAAFASDRPVMLFDECEIEFAVDFSEELNVGFKLYFLSLGGKQKKSESNTVKVRFKALDDKGIIAAAGAFKRRAGRPRRQTKPGK